jgi:hypothetical protein
MGVLFAQEPAQPWMNARLSRDREATGPKNVSAVSEAIRRTVAVSTSKANAGSLLIQLFEGSRSGMAALWRLNEQENGRG